MSYRKNSAESRVPLSERIWPGPRPLPQCVFSPAFSNICKREDGKRRIGGKYCFLPLSPTTSPNKSRGKSPHSAWMSRRLRGLLGLGEEQRVVMNENEMRAERKMRRKCTESIKKFCAKLHDSTLPNTAPPYMGNKARGRFTHFSCGREGAKTEGASP